MTVASIPVLGSTIETQFMRRSSYSLVSSHQAVVAVPTRSLARLATPSGHKVGQRGLAVVILWSPMRKEKKKHGKTKAGSERGGESTMMASVRP